MRYQRSWQANTLEQLKYMPRKCAHDARQRGVLTSAAVGLWSPHRRRSFAQRHNESCKTMYARMPFWKRDAGALIAAPDLRELALGQHGGCLAADGRGANGGCSADSRRCRETFRERSELDGVMPPSRYKRLESRRRTESRVLRVLNCPKAMGRRPIHFGTK